MNTLLKNILWRSRYFLAGLTVIIVAVVCAVSVHQKSERASERALQVHADLQAKQEKLQREESDRAAQKQVEQERLRVEENDRLAKIQQDNL